MFLFYLIGVFKKTRQSYQIICQNYKKCKKNEKSLFLGRLFSFLMHLSFIENLVFDDSVVWASAGAGAATNA